VLVFIMLYDKKDPQTPIANEKSYILDDVELEDDHYSRDRSEGVAR